MSAPGPIGSGSPPFSQPVRHPFPFQPLCDIPFGGPDMRVASSDFHVAPQPMPDRDRERSMNNMSPLDEVFVLIRNLPIGTTQESLRLILLFSSEVLAADLLSREYGINDGYRCALVRFRSLRGAREAQQKLNGRYDSYLDAELLISILPDTTLPAAFDSLNAATRPTQASRSNRSIARQIYNNGSFPSSPDEPLPQFPQHPGFFSELPMPETSTHYQALFSPQSPIGNHLTAQGTNESSKALISGVLGDDDETSDLLKDPVAYAENNVGAASRRRATAPQIPIGQMAMAMSNLSLNNNGMVPGSSLPPFVGPMSPGNGGGSNPGYSTPGQHQAPHSHRLPHQHRIPSQHQMPSQQMHPMQHQIHSQHHAAGQQQGTTYRMPAANPADQNPPCNTLYVGNLPMDTSEEELKAMFSKQRGYKRLCFRTKQNGPMCFVEFEDVSFATKALKELYGHPLHNSVRGGIRLSFSKNPLGVRSGQQTSSQPAQGGLSTMNAIGNGMMNGFTSASGPPPGLGAPPGLGNGRPSFNSNGVGMNGHGNGNGHANGHGNGNGNGHHPTFPLYAGSSISPSAPSTLSSASALPALSASPASPALPVRSAFQVPSAPLERNVIGTKSGIWDF